MDESKLFKALEKDKVAREKRAGHYDLSQLTKEEPVTLRESAVIPDMSPLSDTMARHSSLKQMRNPIPMSSNDMKNNKLIYTGMKNRSVLNAYRELRIQLLDKSDSENITVMISSADSQDNSINTALNLGIAFSLDVNSSAVVVDCNPYSIGLENLVTAQLNYGITDYILDESISMESIIYPTGIDRVSVIPAGNSPEQAVELFCSKSMEDMVYELKNRYSDRFIVLNAPPVLVSSEARVLTRYCDHTVLTVPYGKSSIDSIEEAIESIGASHVSGVVYQQ